MLKKQDVSHALTTHFKLICKLLKINVKHIKLHIVNSKNKKFNKNILEFAETNYHERDYANKPIDIYIYYNTHKTIHLAISTLIHELLHIKLLDLTNLYKTKSKKLKKQLELVEEEIVSHLEQAFATLLIRDYNG